MNSQLLNDLQALTKAIEAGGYNVAPSALVQGGALQVEDLSPTMENVCFTDQHIKLQKLIKTESSKSTLAQFDRQLSYGQFGGSATWEGGVGQEETSDFVRVTVPMCFYSHLRRVTMVADMVATVDGKKATDRAAADAAKKIAADIEFDLFRGREAFTNAGVFDGHPGTVADMPNMFGLDLQIRQSDGQRQAQDLMFGEYGSDDSIVIAGGSTLTQENIEDASVRSAMNMGSADKLVVDPKVLSNYNKIMNAYQRVVLAGSPQDAIGTDLRKQWVSGGTVSIEASRFLSGKTRPASPRSGAGATAPASLTAASTTVSGTTSGFTSGQVYIYYATTCNELGESTKTVCASRTVTATGDVLDVTINHPASGVARYFNVYRSSNGGAVTTAKFVGRIKLDLGQSSTVFRDLNNKQPGFVTGYLLEGDTMAMKELAPYSRLKLAQTDLTTPEAHFRFATLAVTQPRKNVLVDNLR